MSKVKSILGLLVMVVALSVAVTESASASWFIGGTELKTSAALATSAVVDGDVTLLTPALGLAVLCIGPTVDLTSPEIIAGDLSQSAGLSLLGCETAIPILGCKLSKFRSAINFIWGIGAKIALGIGERILGRIFPKTKNTLANIEFDEANTCAFNGEEPLKGSFTLNGPTGQSEEVSQGLIGMGSVENNSLELGSGNKTFLDSGPILLKLASGSKWSFK